jgi:hypothetical protein
MVIFDPLILLCPSSITGEPVTTMVRLAVSRTRCRQSALDLLSQLERAVGNSSLNAMKVARVVNA